MKNNPIAFDELGNQIAKLDGSPLPTTNNLEGCIQQKLIIALDGITGGCNCFSPDEFCNRCLTLELFYKFISDLRKHDMEELIKYLKEQGYKSPNIEGQIYYYYNK